MSGRYRYEVVRDRVNSWSVVARGPKGGRRWIATYGSEGKAERVAAFLNRQEES